MALRPEPPMSMARVTGDEVEGEALDATEMVDSAWAVISNELYFARAGWCAVGVVVPILDTMKLCQGWGAQSTCCYLPVLAAG